jgi:hypothetical protein
MMFKTVVLPPSSVMKKKITVTLILVAVVYALSETHLPARATGMQKTLVLADGQPVQFTLWKASPLTVFQEAIAYVRCGDDWRRIPRGRFGSDIGDLWISPDRQHVLFGQTLEGGVNGEPLFDVKTRTFTAWSGSGPDLSKWEQHLWRNRFELLPTEELYEKIHSSSQADLETAHQEFRLRAQEAGPLGLAESFSDTRLPSELRRQLGLALYWTRARGTEPLLSAIATSLDDLNPDLQLQAAWLLSKIATEPPAKFNHHVVSENNPSTEMAQLYVKIYRRLWDSRCTNAPCL